MEVGNHLLEDCKTVFWAQMQSSKELQTCCVGGQVHQEVWFLYQIMAEYFINALYPDFVVHHVPAMPLEALETNLQPHRDNEPIEQPEPEPMIVESVDPMALAAEVDDDGAPADDEWEDHESREERLRREALSGTSYAT